MNIIRLTTRIYPDESGPAVYTYYLSKNVSGSNFKIFNICCRPKQIKKKIDRINENFIIFYLPFTVPTEDSNLFEKIFFIVKYFLYSFKLINKLHRKYRIDIIHCDNPSITGIIATLFKIIFKIPFIYTQHGLDSPYKLDYFLELELIHWKSTYHVIISRKMKLFYERNKKNLEKLIWIPNGVEINKFFHVKNIQEKKRIIDQLNLSEYIKADDFVIIYIGYMVFEQKVRGMIDFLYSFKDFLESIKEHERKRIKLIYIGDGLYKNLLENEYNKISLIDNVYLLGSKQQIENYYAIADLCVLTSYVEGLPTVLLEAVAAEVPCIGTDVGEIREIITEDTIITPGNREEIEKKLRELYYDKDLCKRSVQRSRKKIEKFNWLNVANEIRNLYIKTLKKRI